ncbi:MAG: SAM-dependent methyltransferase, partial [Nocardioides sp.]
AALYAARQRPVDVVGVSISPEQIRLAKRFASRGDPLRGTARFEVGDFTELPEHLTAFDLAFAIESFVHADPAPAFFHEVAGALRPGGALIIVDDFLTGSRADGRLDDFRAGWHASSLMTVPEAAALSGEAGLALVASRDLSPLQRLGRRRDRFVHALQPALRRAQGRSLWAQSLVGGDALQACHRDGLLEYRLLRFQRSTD